MEVKTGQLARNLFECKRREAASLMIQKYARMFIARRDYRILWASAVSIQTPMRRMAARNEFKYRKETKAAILIQVPNLAELWANSSFGKINSFKLLLP